ncbi:MAG: hypothetical protein JW741_10095, partial [Sedimentisphaerales bacterium]|nr:hypothetical protein [Sedimentisphaerales bacterium]
MGKKSLILIVTIGACLGMFPLAAEASTQTDYTVPARAQLLTGTRSGTEDAYQTLQAGLVDAALTGDDRELKF